MATLYPYTRPSWSPTPPRRREALPDAWLIFVNDCSTDDTASVAAAHGARVLSSPYSMGNGAAIKRGARAASGEILVFMDADGQHDPVEIAGLLERLEQGYDMRSDEHTSELQSLMRNSYAVFCLKKKQ